MFDDRWDAGARLARALGDVTPDALILGIPRGGVVVAAAVADALGAPLDVIVAHKLGAPHNPELAIGGIGPDGSIVVDEAVVAAIGGIPAGYLERERARQADEITRRMERYRGTSEPLVARERTCVVIDDGIATGSTMLAAAMWLRANDATRVVIAVPVAPPDAELRLSGVCDRFVALETPPGFRAVGQFYLDFGEVTDQQVLDVLRGHARSA